MESNSTDTHVHGGLRFVVGSIPTCPTFASCFKRAVALEGHQTCFDIYVNGSRIRKQHYKEGSFTANRQGEIKAMACANKY